MGLRFTKRYTLLPGLRLNISKSTVSLTLGFKHLPQFTISRKKSQLTIPLNIHNAYYTKIWTRKKKKKKIKRKRPTRKREPSVVVSNIKQSNKPTWEQDIIVLLQYTVQYLNNILKAK